jgi:hypothetical protein
MRSLAELFAMFATARQGSGDQRITARTQPEAAADDRTANAGEASNAGGPRLQIEMSPYFGTPDFSGIPQAGQGRLDMVSIADLLRNGFAYPPHSILKDVKLVTYGFNPQLDMENSPEFRFKFRMSERGRDHAGIGEDLVGTYHRLLCEAVEASCRHIASPWLLQSGGKDSTTLAIAAAEARPDMTCVTYLGGSEENEVESARAVARSLGLRHESLVCDPGRAYDRYLAVLGRMPLMTADFALLSYVDLATTIRDSGGDGIVDGMGSDNYFGIAVDRRHRWLSALARGMKLGGRLAELPLVARNFELCYLLSTLQMEPIERVFPGSRFTDAEVDALFGRDIARLSKARLQPFRAEIESAEGFDEWWAIASSIAGSAGSFGKGLYTANALSLNAAYPFCDSALREWVYNKVPPGELLDTATMTNKVLVRKHIATRFGQLPYVARKGSFRFSLTGLARERFDQVHAFAVQGKAVLPGAVRWLERNRARLGNKYHASKFYLLALVLPWIDQHGNDAMRRK